MPGPNAIVGLVTRIDPPVDKAGAAELLRHNPDGVSVGFEGGESARLLQGHVPAGMLDILEQLRQMRAPAYVEVRPDTREITRLFIPLVSRAQAAWKGVQGDPNAALTPTAATVYWRNVMPTDPGYVDTNIRLNYYRQQLKLRSLQPAGPPPYAFCP